MRAGHLGGGLGGGDEVEDIDEDGVAHQLPHTCGGLSEPPENRPENESVPLSRWIKKKSGAGSRARLPLQSQLPPTDQVQHSGAPRPAKKSGVDLQWPRLGRRIA